MNTATRTMPSIMDRLPRCVAPFIEAGARMERGTSAVALETLCKGFESAGQPLEVLGHFRRRVCRGRGSARAGIVKLVGEEQGGEQQRARLRLCCKVGQILELVVDQVAQPFDVRFLALIAGDRIVPPADRQGDVAHRSSASIRRSSSARAAPASLRSAWYLR